MSTKKRLENIERRVKPARRFVVVMQDDLDLQGLTFESWQRQHAAQDLLIIHVVREDSLVMLPQEEIL